MHARAYVLIEAEAGQVGSVISALRELTGVSTADPVTGPYDIIVTIETAAREMIIFHIDKSQ